LIVHAFNARDHAVDLLDAGTIDAAVGVPPTHTDSRILTRPVLRDEFVTIVGKDNPAARRGMDIKTYLALSHVLVSPEGDRHGVVDQALAQRGKKRSLGLTLPQMFVAPEVIGRTYMTATVMRRVALSSSASRRLVLFPPPIELPEVVFDLFWHRRSDSHPGQQWFRNLIASLAAAL
jgi:DNA-binding transcriptional LysR family regulator